MGRTFKPGAAVCESIRRATAFGASRRRERGIGGSTPATAVAGRANHGFRDTVPRGYGFAWASNSSYNRSMRSPLLSIFRPSSV